MCGETRVRVGFGPLLQGPRNPPLFLHIYSPQGIVQSLGFVQIKSSPQLQLRVLRLCPTTRPRRHRTPPSLIKLSFFIHNIQIAISVSCLFFVCSQEIDPRGQVDRAPAWSITPRNFVQRLLRRDVFARSQSDRQSRLPQKTISISSKHRDTFASIKWYQIFRLLGEILQFFIVQIESVLHTYSPRKSQKKIRVSSSHPNQSEPLHNLFCICFVEFAVASSCPVAGLSVQSFRVSSSVHRLSRRRCHISPPHHHHRCCHIPPPLVSSLYDHILVCFYCC